jgi:hypothetical protein
MLKVLIIHLTNNIIYDSKRKLRDFIYFNSISKKNDAKKLIIRFLFKFTARVFSSKSHLFTEAKMTVIDV